MGRLFWSCFGIGSTRKKPTCGSHYIQPQFIDQYHTFRVKHFKKPLPCDVCRQPIYSQGSCCRVCKFVCHKTCEPRVVPSCELTPNYLQSNDGQLRPQPELRKSVTYPVNRATENGPSAATRVRKQRVRLRADSIEMDLIYITERIIAMTFPAGNTEDSYKTALREVTQMLKTKHSENYMVFNLSERRNDVSKLNKQVFDFGWPLHLAPPLERLCSICKAMDSWLNSGPHHIVVLHSKGGKERARVVVAAYMHYSNISASADQALDRFAMKKFFNEKLHGLLPPSQKRYIEYFGGLLSGSIKINNSPLYLQQVFIQGTPNCDYKGGCRLFVKVYQGMQQIYTSGVYSVSSGMQSVPITLETPLQLRGDILVKAYHRRVKPDGRIVIFRCQFHTCAISEYTLQFFKDDLDEACHDVKFPEMGRVEFRFSSAADRHYNAFQDLSVPVDYSVDNIVRWDSYENFDALPEDTLNETGDLDISTSHDGSLYATVAKRPVNGGFPHHASSTAPEIIHGLHTISMDSGISSTSGPQAATGSTPPHSHGTQSTASTGDPLTLTPTPTNLFETHVEVHQRPRPSRENSTSTNVLPDSKEQRKLDELLSGMLADVESIPDIKTGGSVKHVTYSQSPPVVTNGYGHVGLPEATDDEDRQLVYHARKDSQPFTYGVPPASPRLPRRVFPANPNNFNKSETVPLSNGVSNNNSDVDTSYAGLSPHEDSASYDGSPAMDSGRPNDRSAWLQRQQQKLRERTEARMRGDRLPKEQQLISELRSTQHRLNAYREDPGYNTPLHVHTTNGHWQKPAPKMSSGGSAPSSPVIPNRGSSREVTRGRYGTWQTPGALNKPLQRQRSDSSHDRPFVAVKRAHEQAKKQAELQGTNPLLNAPNIYNTSYIYTTQNYPNQHQGLPSTTNAPPKAQTPTGLLTMVEPRTSSPVTSQELDDLEMSLRAVTTQIPQSTGRSVSPILGRNKIIEWSYSQNPVEGSGSPQYSPSTPGIGDRPATPAFPVYPKTPYFNQESTPPPPGLVTGLPPKSPTLSRKERSPSPATVQQLRAGLTGGPHYPSALDGSLPLSNISHTTNGQSSPTVYFGQSRRSSLISLTEPFDVVHHHAVFVKDLSKYWYKPNISREDAIGMLKDSPPGSFVVRDSNSFPGAFGLALKVATPPPNVQSKTGDISNELVRHFLIEPTEKGVKLKGGNNEPVFGSLSALVYQHSITPLSLPCKLILPEADGGSTNGDVTDTLNTSAAAQLLIQGAACNVLYLFTLDTESLTGPQAVRKVTATLMKSQPLPNATVVHFKVSNQGITLTDNNRKLFFRRHYPVNSITHCGIDPDDRRWSQRTEDIGVVVINNQIFGFVARKGASKTDNQCHIFAELEPEQPASAIVNFVTKVMMVPPSAKAAFI